MLCAARTCGRSVPFLGRDRYASFAPLPRKGPSLHLVLGAYLPPSAYCSFTPSGYCPADSCHSPMGEWTFVVAALLSLVMTGEVARCARFLLSDNKKGPTFGAFRCNTNEKTNYLRLLRTGLSDI